MEAVIKRSSKQELLVLLTVLTMAVVGHTYSQHTMFNTAVEYTSTYIVNDSIATVFIPDKR